MRRPIKLAFLALAVLSMSVLPAEAHTQDPYGTWYVWQGQRTINMTSGAGNGYATGETAWRWNTTYLNGSKDYGFHFMWLADYSANGPDECVEAWMDFSRAFPGNPPQGNHRNPTVFRHCNTTGNVWGSAHHAITDYTVRDQFSHFVGWDFVLCRAYRTWWDNKWHRTDCTNEQGAKSFTWVDGSASRDDKSDSEIAQPWCVGTPLDKRDEYGCRIYLHIV